MLLLMAVIGQRVQAASMTGGSPQKALHMECRTQIGERGAGGKSIDVAQ